MSSDENQDIPMAECGACNAIIPLDSKSCPSCGIRISGVSDKELGECGACGHLQPVDSTSCSNCGVSFVAEEQPEVGSSDEETAVSEDPVAEPLPIHEPVPEEIPEEIETNDVEVQEDETTVDEEIDSIDDSFTDDDDIEMGTDDDSSEDKIDSPIDLTAYYLQHAALSSMSAANTAAREAFSDFPTVFSLPQFSQAKLWHVVFSGPYATRTEAMDIAKENGVTADVVIVRGEYVASRVPSEAADDGR